MLKLEGRVYNWFLPNEIPPRHAQQVLFWAVLWFASRGVSPFVHQTTHRLLFQIMI